ncbi:MAG: PSD1 and planctomycete cytochrome C domain-containing protein [Isosphaeraceae bacterium]
MLSPDRRGAPRGVARTLPGLVVAIWLCLMCLGALGTESRRDGGDAAADPAAVEFFEKSVRPILAARCQGCHGPSKQKGGLRLDGRAAVLAGGSTGPAVVPGNTKESLLVDAINYGETYQMPPKSKLADGEIATLTEWVRRGAPWGVETRRGPAVTTSVSDSSKPERLSKSQLQERALYWCFQPIRRATPPAPSANHRAWPRNPIDRFVLAALEERGLAPAPEADKRVLIRRLSFDLTGLPPAPAEIEAFLADQSPDAYEKLVERLLASPHYGERWARHWLDLVRFAETAGHEFDYDIPGAFRYRDYVIRALNADLPYHRFVIEQIAGDLLERPRWNPSGGFNESILGTAFYFLGEGTHSPVDVREEEMRRIDNQIDVLSKTFLGLTVACARCHDHKFDPITSQDYYALAGFLHSSRIQQAFVDSPDRLATDLRRLCGLKESLRAGLRDAREHLPAATLKQVAAVLAANLEHTSPAGAFPEWNRRPKGAVAGQPVEADVSLERLTDSTDVTAVALGPPGPNSRGKTIVFEDFNRDSYSGWFVTGSAFGERPSRAGDFRLDFRGPTARLVPVRAGQAHSGLLAERLSGVLRSRSFRIQTRYIHHLVAGRGGRINVVVDNYEKIRDPIYGGLTVRVDHGNELRWVTQDVGMWLGHTAYLEIADGAAVDFAGVNSRLDDGLGYIAVDEIRMSNTAAPASASGGPDGSSQALDLDALIAALRPAAPARADRLAAVLNEAREIEARLPEPMLALAVADGSGLDEHIHIRGSHKNLGEVVPRRFLEVLGGSDSSLGETGSGRLELAHRMVDPTANPLIARVLVNRLWKHLFGEGIVKSTDNFGAMGQKPTHPELLDWLSSELMAGGWSIKAMQRLLVYSSTYRMSSAPRDAGERLDPTNTYLHRMNVRRLEAEAIRDAILSVSGRLVPALYGPAVPVHLTSFMDGRGRPALSGPPDGDGRRSIYLNVRRNFLDPMLLAFDAPVPFSTMGRRNVSNVPAQALALLNDPLVISQAKLWAERALAISGQTPRARIDDLYMTAFGRPASDQEARASLAFVDAQTQARNSDARKTADPAILAWADLCHVLMNVKAFIFID